MEVNFAMLFTFQESRRTSDPALSRDRGSQLQLGVRLDSEALRLLQCWGKVIQAADIASDLVGACDAPVTAALEIAKQNNGKWYVGSVVERVSYRATCPVIVITDPGIIPN
jgi:hypothetical protein